MEIITFDKAKEIWRKIAKHATTSEVAFELEVHKKLLNMFQVGDFYYFIFNAIDVKFEYVHDSVTTVLNYSPDKFTLPYMMEIIHPEDLPYFLNFESTVTEFFNQLPVDKILKYKVRYDFRIRKSNGDYIRVLQQVTTIQHDDQGGVLRTFCVHTDISHLKVQGKPVLSFIGLEDEPSYLDVKATTIFLPTKEKITPREKDVLRLLIQGMQSKEIAMELGISKETVDKHRKNMIARTSSRGTQDLIAKAIQEGWL